MSKRRTVRQQQTSDLLQQLVDRLAMAKAILVVRDSDGQEVPLGALISMTDLQRLEPGISLKAAKVALAEADLAARDGKPIDSHLLECCRQLVKVFDSEVS